MRTVSFIPHEVSKHNITRLRIYKEGNSWYLDGRDDYGNYSALLWRFDSCSEAWKGVPELAGHFPRLRSKSAQGSTIQIHMTSTYKFTDDSSRVDCRCGWSQTLPSSHDSRSLARSIGDAHLAKFDN